MTNLATTNTDRELWREREGDYYADSIHVTQSGGIGINCGGKVIVKPLRAWFQAADDVERLREVVTVPNITPDTPPGSAMYLRTLREHEKGDPVNARDLINALMWRVGNQRREIARLRAAPVHVDPTGKTREAPHCPSCSCGSSDEPSGQ